jgi:pyruvate/2-oxoglutarate dehydrogenase complex dihydrolipoamide dehydrogenase (E3) component
LALARSGVDTQLNTQVTSARLESGQKVIRATSEGREYCVAVDEILLSIGRVARVEDLNLEAAGIRCTPCGDIEVNAFLQTNNPDVFAAGDACMVQKFTNMAEATGRLAVRNAFHSDRSPYGALIVPHCTYCDPEIAHVGVQIGEARRAQIPLQSFTVMMQDVDRAIVDGRDDGFVKIHVKLGSDEILGATVVASRASEMINEIAVIMHAKMGMRALAEVLHTYPTQSDAIRLAARAYVESQPCR